MKNIFIDFYVKVNFTPKFVKKYAEIGKVMSGAFKEFIDEVGSGAFPTKEHTYKIDPEVVEKLKQSLE
ncbi:3-methyl-2-oxobutanoate hydroxymethyltransferase [Intestinibacter sp.]